MAILKPYLTRQGVEALYHKIVKTELDFNTGSMQIMLAIYLSQAARAAKCAPLYHEYVTIKLDDLTADFRPMLYEMVQNAYVSYAKEGTSDQPAPPIEPPVMKEEAKIAPVVLESD